AAAGAVRLVVEGGVDALNVTAGGNINITTITSDAKSSSLRVGNITSTFGNVVLIAPDDIEAANPGASLVKGSRVERGSDKCDIGGAGALRIDTGTGGLAALAAHDINVNEISG